MNIIRNNWIKKKNTIFKKYIKTQNPKNVIFLLPVSERAKTYVLINNDIIFMKILWVNWFKILLEMNWTSIFLYYIKAYHGPYQNPTNRMQTAKTIYKWAHYALWNTNPATKGDLEYLSYYKSRIFQLNCTQTKLSGLPHRRRRYLPE